MIQEKHDLMVKYYKYWVQCHGYMNGVDAGAFAAGFEAGWAQANEQGLRRIEEKLEKLEGPKKP